MDDNDVRWVPSQTPIPALQELIREAERDRNARQLLLSDACSVPPFPTRTTPLPSALRKPLAPSAKSSQASNVPLEEEPETAAFVELLKGAFKHVDEKALKKQRHAAREKERQREHTRARSRGASVPRPLTKTSSASAICLAGPSKTPAFSGDRGRALAKTASLGPRDVDIASGKSTPHSLSNHSLNPKPASAPQLTIQASTTSILRSTPVRVHNVPIDGDSPMLDAVDLLETDTDRELPITTKVEDDSDSGMDVSFYQAEPPPLIRVPPPSSKPQPPQSDTASRLPPPSVQRTRTGPPPLGMRRPAYLPSSQYSSTQSTKGVTLPKFKPPLLTNTTAKNPTVTRPVTTPALRLPPCVAVPKIAAVPRAVHQNQDPDSSFDVSFDMDIDALEETMKAYD